MERLRLPRTRSNLVLAAKAPTQMGDGYDFFASVRDGVSIQHAFRLTNLVLVVKSKAPYYLGGGGGGTIYLTCSLELN